MILPSTASRSEIAEAVSNNNWILYQTLANHCPLFRCVDRDGLSLRYDQVPNLEYNGVWRTNVLPQEIKRQVERVKEDYQHLNGNHYWRAWSTDQPDNLETVLRDSGYSLLAEIPGMFMKLNELQDDKSIQQGFNITSVQTKEDLDIWKNVIIEIIGPHFEPVATGYTMCGTEGPLHHYIGWWNDEPVALASVLFGAGVAGIYAVGTRSDYRGQGFGRAITLKGLYDARDLGYEVAVLTSSQLGLPVYRRIGFEACCVEKVFKAERML